jgi:hypothetical protein
LDGREIAEASQSGSIVVVDEGVNEGISFIVAIEFVLAAIAAGGRCILDGLDDAAVEAFGHAVGLGLEGAGELVLDGLARHTLSKGWRPEGPAFGLTFHVNGEAVCEFRAIVREDGVNGMAEGFEEAFEAGGDGFGIALCDDLDVNEAGGAFDGDEDVGLGFLQGRQMLKVHMHKAKGIAVEAARLFGGRPLESAYQPATRSKTADKAHNPENQRSKTRPIPGISRYRKLGKIKRP